MWNYGVKVLVVAATALCMWFLQLKIERLQAQNKSKDLQISNLEQTLTKQQNTLASLLAEKKKQEQEILVYEKTRQALEQEIRLKKQAVRKNMDEKSKAWKEQEIPLSVLAVLQGQQIDNKP